MLQVVLTFLIYTTCIPAHVKCVYTGNTTITNMKNKLYAMCVELVADSMTKVGGLSKYKPFYEHHRGYQVGGVIYTIRQKYSAMLKKYYETVHFSDYLTYQEHIHNMIGVQNLYWDVCNLIRMVEIWEHDDDTLFRARSRSYPAHEDYNQNIHRSTKKKQTATRKKVMLHGVTPKYAYYTHIRMKHKLFQLGQDLLRNAISNTRRLQHVKRMYSLSASWRLAERMHSVRKQYTRMMLVYFNASKNFNRFNHREHFMFLQEIQGIYMNIDKLVDMTQEYEDKDKRLKRISRMGSEPGKIGRVGFNDKEHLKQDTLEKQKAYMERKKIAWSLSHDSRYGLNNITKNDFKKIDIAEEGFESDMTR